MHNINVADMREAYARFCESQDSLPIYMHAWWFDAVCGPNWNAIVLKNNSKVVAAMPYTISARYGFRQILPMPFTQAGGLWIDYPANQKYERKLAYEKVILADIDNEICALGVDYFEQHLHYVFTNWLPLYWRGYQQTTRYTYVITNLGDLSAVWDDCSSSVRNKIKKAAETVKVNFDYSFDDFFNLHRMTFERQGISLSYSFEFLKRIDDALLSRNSRKIFYAVDVKGQIHSALYMIWDSKSSYVHMVGENPKLRESGAGIYLVWQAIKYTKEVLGLNVFDFEGSMLESVESVRRSFGAKQIPYFKIYKSQSRVYSCLKSVGLV